MLDQRRHRSHDLQARDRRDQDAEAGLQLLLASVARRDSPAAVPRAPSSSSWTASGSASCRTRRPTAIRAATPLGNIAKRVPLQIPTLRSLGLDRSVRSTIGRNRRERKDRAKISRVLAICGLAVPGPSLRVRPHGRGVGGEGLGHRALGDDGHRARPRVPDVSARLSRRRSSREFSRLTGRGVHRQQGGVRARRSSTSSAPSTCGPAR